MKLVSLFLLMLIWAHNAWAQWMVMNSTTVNDLHDVAFLNEAYGIAVGDGGTILKTLDGGITWTNLNFSGINNFNSVALKGTDTIFVAGTGTLSPTVYRSGDGGITWQKVLLDASTISICTGADGDVFASASFIYRSQDGGETWSQPYTVAPTVNPFDLQAFNNQCIQMGANVGGIITYSAIIGRSVNGGNSFWDFDVFSFPNANALSAFSFTDVDTGYLFMNNYDFFTPNDSSELIRVFNFQLVPGLGADSMWVFNYQSLNLLFGDYVNDCKFFKDHTGYAAGSQGKVYRSIDGGITWTTDYSGSGEIFALSMTDDNNGYAVGAGGVILKRSIATTVEPFAYEAGNVTIYPNPVADQTIISFFTEADGTASIRVMALNGIHFHKQYGFPVSRGLNKLHVNLESLPSGPYVLSILTEQELFTERVEIIR